MNLQVRARVAPNVLEVIRARLCLPSLDRSRNEIVLNDTTEIKSFIGAAAFWSQPHSVGVEGWREEHQELLHGVLMGVLRKTAEGAL